MISWILYGADVWNALPTSLSPAPRPPIGYLRGCLHGNKFTSSDNRDCVLGGTDICAGTHIRERSVNTQRPSMLFVGHPRTPSLSSLRCSCAEEQVERRFKAASACSVCLSPHLILATASHKLCSFYIFYDVALCCTFLQIPD